MERIEGIFGSGWTRDPLADEFQALYNRLVEAQRNEEQRAAAYTAKFPEEGIISPHQPEAEHGRLAGVFYDTAWAVLELFR